MPTYVYRCKSCAHEFETIQRMVDDALTQCPVCDGVISRLLFPPAISFKGSGFHVNDYPDTKSMVSGRSSKPAENPAATAPATTPAAVPETPAPTKAEK